jgi:hypothetical protein
VRCFSELFLYDLPDPKEENYKIDGQQYANRDLETQGPAMQGRVGFK